MNQKPETILLGLAAPAYSGKDSLADHLVQYWNFKTVRIADPIEESLTRLLAGSGIYLGHYKNNKEEPIPTLNASWRQLMQRTGQWIRQYSPTLLIDNTQQQINFFRGEYNRYSYATYSHEPQNVVVTDIRTPAEAAMIRANGGTIVHIIRENRPNANPDTTEDRLIVKGPDIILENFSVTGLIALMDDWLTTNTALKPTNTTEE